MERLTVRARRQIHKDMKATLEAVDRIYAQGKARVIPLDDEVGLRPSERLAAGCGLAMPDRAVDASLEFDAEAPVEPANDPTPNFS